MFLLFFIQFGMLWELFIYFNQIHLATIKTTHEFSENDLLLLEFAKALGGHT